MKKILFALLIIASGCSHTTEENYSNIYKVVGELNTIKDSIDYVHATLSTNLPGSEDHIVSDKKGTRYEESYVNLVAKNDSAHGKMMKRYSVLYEHYNTYKEMFGLIYKELPKDSAAKNEAIKQSFEEAIK
jgi:hypothetical protein